MMTINKKLFNFLIQNGFDVFDNRANINLSGYDINLIMLNRTSNMPFLFFIPCFMQESDRTIILHDLKNLKMKTFNVIISPYGLLIQASGLSFEKVLMDNLNAIINVLRDNNIKDSSYCPVCGNSLTDSETKECYYEGFNFLIHTDCVETVNEAIDVYNQEFDRLPNNYLKGFLGALIGAAAGALLFIVIYLIGFISAWASILGTYLSCKLYVAFKGKPNKLMVLITILPNVLLQLGAIVLMYAFAAKIAFAENGVTTVGLIEAFSACMATSEFALLFYRDLILSLVFCIIGILPAIKNLKNQTNRPRGL